MAIADADLTTGLPAHLTAWTGCDALGQAILAFVPAGWDSIAGQTALRAIKLIAEALPRAVANGDDRLARRDQMLGSSLSALAMYNAPPTYAGEHLFAEPVGAALQVHHGLAVAVFLAGTAEFNRRELAEPYAVIARELGISPKETAASDGATAFVQWLRGFVQGLGVVGLGSMVPDADPVALARRCASHDAYALNPRTITEVDAVAIIKGALDGTFTAPASDAVSAPTAAG